jgi:hypothetical protein
MDQENVHKQTRYNFVRARQMVETVNPAGVGCHRKYIYYVFHFTGAAIIINNHCCEVIFATTNITMTIT